MPLEEATERLIEGHQQELEVVLARARARSGRGEEVRWDPVTRMATWESRRGEVIGRWYGEVVATYVLRDRILRWSWAGRESASHAEEIEKAGSVHDVPQLTHSVVADLDETDALALAQLGVVLVRGQGLHVERGATELELIGLFDSARPRLGDASHMSLPPPHVVTHSTPPRASTPPTKIGEPARALFVPVATAVTQSLARTGYRQALFVIHSSPVAVSLTIIDAAGLLRSIDLPPAVLEAATTLVSADRAEGNGPWKKLSARITPKADGGATLAVHMNS